MLFKEQEKEIAKLDYELHRKAVDEQIEKVIKDLKEYYADGAWIDGVVLQEICFEHISLSEYGISVFCKFEHELTDPVLWKKLKESYDVFVSFVEGVEGGNLTFYAMLNGPITQKAYFALFNPESEFLTPILDIKEDMSKHMEQKVFSEEVLVDILLNLDSEIDSRSDREDVYSDETGEYVKVRGNWKRRSCVNAEGYFWFTLFGGIFGIHKFYAKSYGNFVVYLFTLGFFGIGWLFDLTEICLGVAKDRSKAYIGPFENRKEKVVMTMVAVVIYIVVLMIFF